MSNKAPSEFTPAQDAHLIFLFFVFVFRKIPQITLTCPVLINTLVNVFLFSPGYNKGLERGTLPFGRSNRVRQFLQLAEIPLTSMGKDRSPNRTALTLRGH